MLQRLMGRNNVQPEEAPEDTDDALERSFDAMEAMLVSDVNETMLDPVPAEREHILNRIEDYQGRIKTLEEEISEHEAEISGKRELIAKYQTVIGGYSSAEEKLRGPEAEPAEAEAA